MSEARRLTMGNGDSAPVGGLTDVVASRQVREVIKAAGLDKYITSVTSKPPRGRRHLVRTEAHMRQASQWTGADAAAVLAAMQTLPGVVDTQMPFARPTIIRRRDQGTA